MQYRYKRIVVGRNSEGKSAVLTTTSDNVDEIHCTPGDCILVKGVNHARRVRGSEPSLMMGVSLDALPLKSPRFAQTTGI